MPTAHRNGLRGGGDAARSARVWGEAEGKDQTEGGGVRFHANPQDDEAGCSGPEA